MNYEERKSIGDGAYKKANQMKSKNSTLTIKDFSIDELKCFLVTCDGMGPNFKEMALNELIEKVSANARDAIVPQIADLLSKNTDVMKRHYEEMQ